MRFEDWFAGLDRGPQETERTACSALALVRRILSELARHSWEPLAEAARLVQVMGRFAADRPDAGDNQFCDEAVDRANALIAQAAASADSALPFPALLRLVTLVRDDPRFAPVEREARILSINGRDVSFDHAEPRTPLWALDLALGQLLSLEGVWNKALPCPGAMILRSLAAELRTGERRVAIAEALETATTRLLALAQTARRRARTMETALSHLRSNARAPQVWIAATAFAPLGLEQVAAAFGVSRRGTYTIGAALVAAGCANRTTRRGMVLLVGQEPVSGESRPVSPRGTLAPSPALADFDAALADLDRLLVRYSDDPD